MNKETDRANELAEAHWGYVGQVLKMHGITDPTLRQYGFHYTTAFAHAYGHAIEDEHNGMFRPRIGDTLSPAEVNAVAKVAKVKDADPLPSAAISLCETCAIGCRTEGSVVTKCWEYTPADRKVPPDPLDFTLPSYAVGTNRREALEKFREELEEYGNAADGSMAQLIEAWDCAQVSQTYREHGGCIHDIPERGAILCNLTSWHNTGRPVMQARKIMLIKNAAREMYSEADNARILADV